ncbi:MAG TPA: class II fumarate hydratase [Chloroflexota bacterium]|nr:class II fumarate hydratase [Chloroflexota bacterium]
MTDSTTPQDQPTRVERDTMGEMRVPASAYYGASTQRAVLNFPISTLRMPRRFIWALGTIKEAAAQVNRDLGLLEPRLADAIAAAAREVAEGKFDQDFPVDVFQTGSGTSTNMNANEVIANRATELLGGQLGKARLVHPNDQVNLGQSSNDVVPSAMHLAALAALRDDLLPAVEHLEAALRQKSSDFWPIIKTGRTHLMDATPIRLGQEFLGYAGQLERARRRLTRAREDLEELALGGTAVGTGINTHEEFAQQVCAWITQNTGIPVHETTNHFQAQSTLDGIVSFSGAVRGVAISLTKIANDLRFFASGPRAGLAELTLPEVQPGSSIMPGKVNPVIAEALIQVGAQVLGDDQTIAVAGLGGYFELNTMMPVAAYNLLQEITLLGKATSNFADQAVAGLQATSRGPELLEKGLAIATALAPVVGYDRAAKIAKEAAASGQTVREVAREQTNLTEEQLNEILNPEKMVEPGTGHGPAGG